MVEAIMVKLARLVKSRPKKKTTRTKKKIRDFFGVLRVFPSKSCSALNPITFTEAELRLCDVTRFQEVIVNQRLFAWSHREYFSPRISLCRFVAIYMKGVDNNGLQQDYLQEIVKYSRRE